MRKIFLKVKWRWVILLIFLMVVSFLIKIKPVSVRADANCPEFKIWVEDKGQYTYAPDPFPNSIQRFTYKISIKDRDDFKEYVVYTGQGDIGEYKSPPFTAYPDPDPGSDKYFLQDTVIYNMGFGRNTNESFSVGPHDITVKLSRNDVESDYCKLSSAYSFLLSDFLTPSPTPDASCVLDVIPKSLTPLDPFDIVGTKVDPRHIVDKISIEAYDETLYQVVESQTAIVVNPTPTGSPSYNFKASFGKKAQGKYQIRAYLQEVVSTDLGEQITTINTCRIDITTCASGCGAPSPTLSPSPVPPTPTNPDICGDPICRPIRGSDPCINPDCKVCSYCHPPTPILSNTPIPPLPNLVPLCEQVGTDFKDKCHACVDPPNGGMWTAIGCLPTTGLEAFLKDYVFTFGIGIAGGIAFLYFLYGVFLFLTSAGNAETVGQAKEIIVSALSGLLFIIFSIFFLQLIGVQILRIPGFG